MLLAITSAPASFWGAVVVFAVLAIVAAAGIWKGYGI